MIGQGRPKTSQPHASARRALTRAAVCWLCALILAGHSTLLVAAEFRLRMSWGGTSRQWYGSVRLSEGSIEKPESLGMEADESGSMWIDKGGLKILQRSPRKYDGVDLSVRAPRDAKLVVQLTAAGDQPSAEPIEISLNEVLTGSSRTPLDNQGNRLLVERAPGDLLPIHLDSRSMVFAPGDDLSFRLDPTHLNVAPSEKVRFVAQLKDPYAEKAVWQSEVKTIWESDQTTTADGEMLRWQVPLNVEEGIYQLTITATQPGWLPLPQAVDAPLVGSKNQASRMIELVVLNHQRPNIPTGTLRELDLLKPVEEIDPTHPDWWKRFSNLPQFPRLKRLWNGPLGNNRSEVVQHSLGSLVRLAPNKNSGDLSWEAYTIPIKEPGTPHLLEIRYPSDRPQTFGVSVVEANKLGASQLANLDTGVDQFEEVVGGNQPAEWRYHRVVFWPKTKTPIVLITNRRETDPAFYGKIQVSRIAGHLPRAYPAGSPSARLFAAYLDRPLFPESFSAEEVFEAPSPLGMDDWKTFYQGGTRLVEYLNHVGYGGLILSVLADGGTIYPSELLEPNTRYDTGAHLKTGQDPVRKDGLEMLFRLFDRERLKLIPAVEFATPLPRLEAAIRQGGPETQGMVWIGRDGRSWPQVYRSYQGRAPYYNVLHPQVQEAMLEVLQELVERYGHHPSFAGITIQLSSDGYAQLPAASKDWAWGLDDYTMRRFQEDARVKLAGEGPGRFEERFRQLASPQLESVWLDWRAEQVAAFYCRAHRELTACRPDMRLYLSGARMFEGEAMQQQLRPKLSRRVTLERTMMQVGIDPARYSDPAGPTLLFSETVLPWTSLANQSVQLELESMRKAEDLAADFGATGALFYHRPQPAPLPSFDQLSPFQRSYTLLTTQPVPSGAQNRRRLVQALAHFDPTIAVDGSLRMPLGQEDSLRNLISLYRRLPASRFRAVEAPAASEPLALRYLSQADATYLLVANQAGFPVSAKVRLRSPAGCRLEELTGTRQASPLQRDKDGCYWEVQLAPYDAIGARLPSQQVTVLGASATWSPEIDRELEQRVSELEARRIALGWPRQWGDMENPGFEQDLPMPGEIPGWKFRQGDEPNVQVDNTAAHSGNASLQLRSEGEPTSVVSVPFTAPKTGRLDVKVWARCPKGQTAPPLRIGVFGDCRGRTFSQSAPSAPIGEEWTFVGVEVRDVPAEGLGTLQLHFQLAGPGEVWLDDVQLEDLPFSDTEHKVLIKTVYPARATLADKQVTQCLRILESYWPRFLLQHVPAAEIVPPPTVARSPQPTSPASEEKPDEKEESPGFMGRIRNLVPDRLRF